MLAAATVLAAHVCRAVTAWLKERQREAPPEILSSFARVAGVYKYQYVQHLFTTDRTPKQYAVFNI